jgi:CMP/dCMP kinase
MIIAIDGPAASGKSTVGEKVANQFGLLFFDTGIMYRAVTLAVLMNNVDTNDEPRVAQVAEQVRIDIMPPSKQDGRKTDIFVDGKDVTWDVRSQNVEQMVSKVAAYRGVREAMTAQQRRIGQQGNVVMVGRDIGTIVCPQADLKVFMDASPEERATRRYEELLNRGDKANYDEILAATKIRDEIDSNRKIAPLIPAADAVIITTDGLTVDEVVSKIVDLVKQSIEKVSAK